MKQVYPRYGAKTEVLEGNLSSGDRDTLQAFLQFCRMTASEGRVVSKYQRYLLHFRDIIEKPYGEVTKADAIAFWGLVARSPYSEHTKIEVRKVVRRFLKWLHRDLDMIEPLKVPSNYLVNKQRVNKAALLTEEELLRMLHRAERLRDKVLLVLFFETGARPQEIRELKWGDINWQGKEVHLYSRKTANDRDLPLHEAMKHLERWKAEWVFPDPTNADYIFPSTIGARYNREKAISISYINRVIKSLARKAGIERNVYPYLLRHTRLTHIRKRGVQGIEFNKFAGHAAGSRHEAVYVHLDNEDMKQSIIEKVYRIKEPTPDERQRYEQRIDRLEGQLREVLDVLAQIKPMLATLPDSNAGLAISVKDS